jgi:hypothetical protein
MTTVASGSPSVSKQRIAIEGKFNTLTGKSTWVLVPLSKGELTADKGTGFGTGDAKPAVVRRNGQSVVPIVGGDSLTGMRGAIELEEKVESRGAGHGHSADMGTWSFEGIDGAYAGYAGGGGFAAVGMPNGALFFRMEGYVTKR